MSVNTLVAFSLGALLLLVIPGPAVLYIVARSAAQGRRAGLVSVAGIHLGTVVHVVAAMVGLSAVLAASAAAFTTVKLIGAGYLVWLGVQSLRTHRYRADDDGEPAVEVRPLTRVFVDGVILNILNPKTALFFLSFVPQFIDSDTSSPVLDLATLGAVFIGLGLVSDGAYALAGGWVGTTLRRSPRFRRTKDVVAGTTYIGLGVVTALGGGRSS